MSGDIDAHCERENIETESAMKLVADMSFCRQNNDEQLKWEDFWFLFLSVNVVCKLME